jgi:hypothetical protein
MTAPNASHAERVAHCRCGSLRTTAMGGPFFISACFCEQCVRRSGSTFGIGTHWLQENVKLSGPATRIERDCQEGCKATLFFCPTCESTVYWEIDRGPEALGVAAGALFYPNFLPRSTVSVWERSKPHWINLPAAVHFSKIQHCDFLDFCTMAN